MPNKMERFSQSTRKILSMAQFAAEESKSTLIRPVHVLLAMTREQNTGAYKVLQDFDIIEAKLIPFIKSKRQDSSEASGLDLSDGVKRMLELSVDTARRYGNHYINDIHMLIGLLRLTEKFQTQADAAMIRDVLDHFDVSAIEIIKHAEAHHFTDWVTYAEPFGCRDALLFLFNGTGKRKNDE